MIDLEGILNLQYAYNYAPHLHTVRTFTAQFIEVWQHAVALKKEILLFIYVYKNRPAWNSFRALVFTNRMGEFRANIAFIWNF